MRKIPSIFLVASGLLLFVASLPWVRAGEPGKRPPLTSVFAPPTPTPTPAEAVNVLAASYSFGSDFADVTARVRQLLAEGKTFQANPGWLLADPHPYWNKALVIVCEVRGKRAIFSVGENENVSRELLLEKARPIALGTAAATPAPTPETQAYNHVTVSEPRWPRKSEGGSHKYVDIFRGDEQIRVDLWQASVNPAYDLKLQPGDTVEVPEGFW